MAIFKNGQWLGKLGNTTSYLLNGKLVGRLIGKTTKSPTVPQKEARLKTRMISDFLKPISEFTEVGFELEARRLRQRAQNPAFAYNRKHATAGRFPHVKIDFSKVLLSYGLMPVPVDVTVKMVEEGFLFSWGQQEGLKGTHWSDQVMLMAYFSKMKKAKYLTSATSRYKGQELLPIFDIPHGEVAETYISFVSNDRKSISNSVYAGKVTW